MFLSDDEDGDSDTPKESQGPAVEDESVAVGDRDRITEIYHDILESIQQVPLKKIVKVWIKTIHPQKQSKHPYNGGTMQAQAIAKHGDKGKGEDTKPEWWPRDIVHRGPDHILKPG